MLILSRKVNESIVIDGRIIVKIVRLEGDLVKVGIDAPTDVPVHRQEVYEEIQRNNREALTRGRPSLPRLPKGARPQALPRSASPQNGPSSNPQPRTV